jgi:ADP-heptose:LPS heptosyltransferase
MSESHEQSGAGPRVLAIHSGALGDVVMLAQALGALRARGASVTLAAGGAKAHLLRELGAVDAALDFDALEMHELFAEPAPADPHLPRRLAGHDRLISCFAGGNLTAASRLAVYSGADEVCFLPPRPVETEPGHLLDQWARRLGLPEPLTPGPWTAPEAIRRRGRGALAEMGVAAGQRYVSIHVGAGAAEKCRPVTEMLALAGALTAPVVFILGPAEIERWGPSAEQTLRAGGRVLCEPTLTVLAGVLADSAGHVGFDTGPTHLAAALGTPTVAIFGPTDPARFGPRGPRATATVVAPDRELPIEAVLERLAEAGESPRA